MTLQDLTKKNQEFVHIATNQLLADGKSDAEIKAILEEHLPEIIDNQKKGITARSLLGAPTTWAASFTERPEDKARVSVQKNTNPWLMWLDTSLLFLGLVTALNGLMLLFGQSNVNTGLISILTLGFGGGAAMYVTYYYIYRHMGKPKSERPGWLKSFAVLALVMLVWFALFAVVPLLPATINPKLPEVVLFIIALASFGLRFYLQRKYNIQSSMAPVTPQQRR
ncbi:TPA: DUF1129 family protein [Streptococcus agalactiae]|nr:DUF1129 family protein [Streptococcus agalactiae]